ncbi:MAG: LysR family transcriptional regulator [Marinobacter sp.]|uniref:LysR family transcriptional regulator n=1 Tax=Marinobacter sp. TaxID=50741 RepID=UPI00299F4EB0|nr:LysR family transcriptional regulator [Marinobacter sp.]MDX1635213.1 LysR family transcriptional regulator [Marinobacter sp.]
MKDTLNLRHLHYFWVITREGSIARASEVLDLAPQTLSGQLASLEQAVGGRLFRRQGRGLVPTELGQMVAGYAREIFALTDELTEQLKSEPTARPLALAAGVSASIHKLIAFHLLQPALELDRQVSLDCRTGRTEALLFNLKKQELDVVLTDRIPGVEAHDEFTFHPLGGSTISLFAAPGLAERLQPGFPASLDGESLLANSTDSPYFDELMKWMTLAGVRMNLLAQVDDSALIKVFGRQGLGVFTAPTIIADEVCRQYQVVHIGALEAVTEQLYAVTRSRSISHDGVRAICEAAPGFMTPANTSEKTSN